jgi:MOSC domain-containing protein
MKIGEVAALFRYPVKSMRGEAVEAADLGRHGLEGDRRLALHRAGDRGGFPWLTASKLPDLLLYAPLRREPAAGGILPTHVRTPEGEELPVFGPELAADVGRRHGSTVEMMHLSRGVFDDAAVSVIAAATVAEIGRLSGQEPDVRRFRPNVLIAASRAVPFEEDDWLGGVLTFGEDGEGGSIGVTALDERCAMVNYDPDSARPAPEVLKAIVRERSNRAGVYATVTRCGPLRVGQPVFLEPGLLTARRAG